MTDVPIKKRNLGREIDIYRKDDVKIHREKVAM